MSVSKGTLIVFEGIDGSGKSVQAKRLVAWLEELGVPAVATREPTQGEYGQKIRELAQGHRKATPQEECELFFRDRREHVLQVIEPALERGQWVVSDRYYLSTVCYQGARGLNWKEILQRSQQEFPKPDLVILLEMDAAAGLARVSRRGDQQEVHFEEQTFLERAVAHYAQLACENIVRIDATRSEAEVEQAIRLAVKQRLSLPIVE